MKRFLLVLVALALLAGCSMGIDASTRDELRQAREEIKRLNDQLEAVKDRFAAALEVLAREIKRFNDWAEPLFQPTEGK